MSIFTPPQDGGSGGNDFSPNEGYLAVAPYGSAAPADGTTALEAPWIAVGLVASDSGPSEARNFETNDLAAWPSGRVVRRVPTTSSLTVDVTLVETNAATIELFYGAAANIDGRVSIIPGRTGGQFSMVKDIWNGHQIVRTYYPNCEVTSVGDQQVNAGETFNYPITITAEVDPNTRDENGNAVAAFVWFTPIAQAEPAPSIPSPPAPTAPSPDLVTDFSYANPDDVAAMDVPVVVYRD
jgi:hypothetical protein